MRGRFKKWAAPFLAEHSEIVMSEINQDDPFWKAPLFLEIGAGKGDFGLQLSLANPSVHLLCLERDISIAGTFAKKAVNEGRDNLRVIASDFDNVYEPLKGLKFERIYLNFSDPWPKKKHEKRRLTVLARLNHMSDLLSDQGEIRIKTDNNGLYAFTLEQIALGQFEIVKEQDHYEKLDEDDFMSEYERNFREQGKTIHRVIIRKKVN